MFLMAFWSGTKLEAGAIFPHWIVTLHCAVYGGLTYRDPFICNLVFALWNCRYLLSLPRQPFKSWVSSSLGNHIIKFNDLFLSRQMVLLGVSTFCNWQASCVYWNYWSHGQRQRVCTWQHYQSSWVANVNLYNCSMVMCFVSLSCIGL